MHYTDEIAVPCKINPPHPHPSLSREGAGEGQQGSAPRLSRGRVLSVPLPLCCGRGEGEGADLSSVLLNEAAGAQLFYLLFTVPQLAENFAGVLTEQRRGLHLYWTVR